MVCFFCFKQKTAYEMRISDWSSDVCSSDLGTRHARPRVHRLGTQAASRSARLKGQKSGQTSQKVYTQAAPSNARTKHLELWPLGPEHALGVKAHHAIICGCSRKAALRRNSHTNRMRLYPLSLSGIDIQ